MKLISKNNYEAYLLDYMEKNLSPELTAELMLFFENNPEYREDLEDFEIHQLVPIQREIIDKNELKKSVSRITLNNYEDYIVAEIEGLNSMEESKLLDAFLEEHSDLRKDLIAFNKTKLEAPSIIFKEKKELCKKETKIIPLYWWSSVAAAMIAGVIWLMGSGTRERQYYPLAEHEEINVEIQEDSSNFYISDEQAEVELKKKPISPKRYQKAIALNGTKKKITTDKIEEKQLAELVESEEIPDSSSLKMVQHQNPTPDILIAENNVKITYEEEASDNIIPTTEKKRMTKLGALRIALKQQVKSKFLDKGKERVLLAINSKPASFIRGRKKN